MSEGCDDDYWMNYYKKYSEFSIVVPNKLCGMRYPDGSDMFIEFLINNNILGLVSLTEWELKKKDIYEESGIEYLHIPVVDFKAPSIEQADKFIEFVDRKNKEGTSVVCHCMGGHGRTGTMLVCYLLKHIQKEIGENVDDIIKKLREMRPGSVESKTQIEFLKKYENVLKKRESLKK